MTFRAFLLVVLAIGWWRVPAALGSAVGSERGGDTGPAVRASVAFYGLAIGALSVVLAWMSGPILDWLEVDTETFRIAAGLATAGIGLGRALGWGTGPEVVGTGTKPGEVLANAWPVAYPVLFGPLTLLAAVSVGSDHGVWLVLSAVLCAVALSVAMSRISRRRWAPSLVRGVGVLLMVLAVALIFDGLRDV